MYSIDEKIMGIFRIQFIHGISNGPDTREIYKTEVSPDLELTWLPGKS